MNLLIYRYVIILETVLGVGHRFKHGHDLILAQARQGIEADNGMLLIEVLVLIFAQAGKHGAVIHVVAVDHHIIGDTQRTIFLRIRLPWGPVSTRSTFFPCCASPTPRLTVLVVLPTLCKALHNVGKSTMVYNLGAGLALEGKKVLLLDTDLQGDLTKMHS